MARYLFTTALLKEQIDRDKGNEELSRCVGKEKCSLEVELNTSGHARLKDKQRTLAVDIQSSVFMAPPVLMGRKA